MAASLGTSTLFFVALCLCGGVSCTATVPPGTNPPGVTSDVETSQTSSRPVTSSQLTASHSSRDEGVTGTTSELDLWLHLPRAWSSMCNVDYDVDSDVNATIKCRVTAGDDAQLRLADLRSPLSALMGTSGLELQVSLDITCDDGGTISLPFPMRCPGLVKLSVLNCRLRDKYGDFGTEAALLGDWLREERVQHSVWVEDPADLDRVMANLAALTNHYECGQDSTLVKLINRNVSGESSLSDLTDAALDNLDLNDLDLGGVDLGLDGSGLPMNSNVTLDDILQNAASRDGSANASEAAGGSPTPSPAVSTTGSQGGQADVHDTLVDLDTIAQSHFCRYEKLEVMEDTQRPITSRNHFELMTMGARYPNLRVLNFSAAGLTEVPLELRQWRRKFPGSQLSVIDLSHNNIQRVGLIPAYPPEKRHDGGGRVHTTLVLQFNNITELSLADMQLWAVSDLFTVDISNNPFSCTCRIKALLTQLQNDSLWAGPAMSEYRRQLSVMACATPPELAGRAIGSLEEAELDCVTRGADLTPVIAALVVTVVLLLGVLVLALNFRKEVRILLYTRVNVLLPCGPSLLPAPADAPEKLYDAFVSYANGDSPWVLNSLRPRLEDRGDRGRGAGGRGCMPLKLCLHQRDFVPGKPIIDNIIDCIAASRHTIVVLSNSFVKSAWAMEELQQAYRQSMDERRRHLVVVMLEDVPHSDMAPVLRRVCQTFTYISAQHSFFWDRLLFSIQIDDNSKKDNRKTRSSLSSSRSLDEYDDITACSNEASLRPDMAQVSESVLSKKDSAVVQW